MLFSFFEKYISTYTHINISYLKEWTDFFPPLEAEYTTVTHSHAFTANPTWLLVTTIVDMKEWLPSPSMPHSSTHGRSRTSGEPTHELARTRRRATVNVAYWALLALLSFFFLLWSLHSLLQEMEHKDSSRSLGYSQIKDSGLAIARELVTHRRDSIGKEEVASLIQYYSENFWTQSAGENVKYNYYDEFPHVDVDGGDLGHIDDTNLSTLKRICDALPTCRGFNSNGWLKSNTQSRVPSAISLFVKIPLAFRSSHKLHGVQDGDSGGGGAGAGGDGKRADRRRKGDDHRGSDRASASYELTSISEEAQIRQLYYSAQGIELEMLQALAHLRIYSYSLPQQLATVPPVYHDYKYAIEGLFEDLLQTSTFYTTDPEQANFFFVPVRCAAQRFSVASRAEGQVKAEEATRGIVEHIKHTLPYWNRSLGSDHFFLCTHDMGASCAASADPHLLKHAIAIVNTAEYNDPFFSPHKDISLPSNPGDGCPTCTQGSLGKMPLEMRDSFGSKREHADVGEDHAINDNRPLWPSFGLNSPSVKSKRSSQVLAFFVGNLAHGQLRTRMRARWGHDPDIVLVDGMLPLAAYHERLRSARFCLHLRGHRGWSPRLMDIVWAGCVPVIIADHYHPPLQGLLDWDTFSIRVREEDVDHLKDILLGISAADYMLLTRRLARARDHLIWNNPPIPFDAFYSLLLLLWRRHSTLHMLGV